MNIFIEQECQKPWDSLGVEEQLGPDVLHGLAVNLHGV